MNSNAHPQAAATALSQVPELIPALRSKNPLAWLVVFGPGAIVASLTIGTGELVFSSRGGVLFGYNILWLFLLTCVLKWVLVFSAARHMVLSGVHPFERYTRLPGPHAWFTILLLIFSVSTFPIWMGFLSGVLGTLGENLVPKVDAHLWAAGSVTVIAIVHLIGGYDLLEKVQIAIVLAMLAAVVVSFFFLKPDWLEVLLGLIVPAKLSYPEWLPEKYATIAERSVWVETSTYVGVVAGSGFDYLAYVSFLRHKSWGLSGGPAVDLVTLESRDDDADQRLRSWIRAPLVDCTASFVAVLLFAVVFVASGHIVLGPEREVPSGNDLLMRQAEFVTQLHPLLFSVYILGAILTMVGTLYGLLEIAPAVISEQLGAIRGGGAPEISQRFRVACILWTCLGGLGVLLSSYLYSSGEGANPPALVAIITPANLFTGVLACGFICMLNPWMDRKFLPRNLRIGTVLVVLNFVGGVFFLVLGVHGYWKYGETSFADYGGGWIGGLVLLATVVIGLVAASLISAVRGRPNE